MNRPRPKVTVEHATEARKAIEGIIAAHVQSYENQTGLLVDMLYVSRDSFWTDDGRKPLVDIVRVEAKVVLRD